MKAQQIFEKEFRGSKNFMTPHVIEYGNVKANIAYELSDGEGFSHETIYGVTVVNYNPITRITERAFDKDKMCESLTEAREYIQSLKNS
jgi:hypothetical protein